MSHFFQANSSLVVGFFRTNSSLKLIHDVKKVDSFTDKNAKKRTRHVIHLDLRTEQIKLGGSNVLFELKLCIVKVKLKFLQRVFIFKYF